MVETNPAAALLDANTGAKGIGNSGSKSADDGAFSREFEQVTRGSESQQNAASGAVDEPEEKVVASADESDSTTAEEHESPSGTTDETAEDSVAASGKNLPPDAALELEPELPDVEDEAAAAITQAETTQNILQGVVPQDAKQLQAGVSAEAKQVAVLPTTIVSEGDGEAAADEALPFSGRLRDLAMANLQGGSKDDNSQSALKQGKGDSNLFTLVNNNRGASTFGEMFQTANTAATTTGAATTQQSSSSQPTLMTLNVPMQQKGWDQAMGERVVWMARTNIQQAQIQLNPRELGPIEIKISVQNEQTNVNFVAHHATTRDALEAAIPRLREMLGEQGLNLGQADVSQHSFGDNQGQAGVAEDSGSRNGQQHHVAEGDEADNEVTLHTSHVSTSAVDIFA